MKSNPPAKLEQARIRTGPWGSDGGYGMYGAFRIAGPCGSELVILASAGVELEDEGWEHASVSVKHRTPNWTEMCFVKDLFWEDHETVVQFHPRKSEYVNQHPFALHLWKNNRFDYVLPNHLLVGTKKEFA